MKLFNLRVLAGGLALLALGSCTKRLDKNPYNAIALSQSFQSVKDAKTWNAGVYSYLRGRVYGIYSYTTDVQGDQLNATLDFGNRNGAPHRWDFTSDDYSIRDIWSGYYSGITNLNIQIAGFNEITPASSEMAELNRYKGDAYLARAYYYHQLIQLFAKPYEPASAATDLGVPLVLDYDVSAKPARATVKAVYDQILSDIAQAKTLLSGVAGAQGSPRFTKDVVLALEARVRLNMQDWAGAKTAADAVIAAGTYPLINNQLAFTDYWAKGTVRTESILQLQTIAPSELANANSIYLGYIASTKRYDPDFIPSQWVVDKYDNVDIRKAAYFAQLPATIQGTSVNNVWMVTKYKGDTALFTGATTNYEHAPKIFRIAEMYLVSAEAGAKVGGTSETDGLGKLNSLRTARGLAVLTGLTGTALLNAVKDERFRELAFEGFRLLDLKRWHEPMVRHDPQNTAMLTTGANYYSLTIAADNQKFVWGLPANDVTVNANLKQNPGW